MGNYYSVSGDMPAPANGQPGQGNLRQYSTFRYTLGGPASLTVNTINAALADGTIISSQDLNWAGMRAGLRNTDGNQITPSAQWGYGVRGNVPFGNVNGYVAINARVITNKYAMYPNYIWSGTLYLGL
ncbi:hypothetical protein ITJ43_14265 [Microbacterium sp. VKM Ac-2870]|uniref:hypothetical protein n=1 Tax=Microbacterium sp. VKM Ac-2870 TaxID=2783825 RepID=UPI00188C3B25|nr:hypothetical protein [Microbacterium sp. VKM Ac-2870]MBF4563295.1 hypothetical protein [Microbacterium sp. VKM Ac-2870]